MLWISLLSATVLLPVVAAGSSRLSARGRRPYIPYVDEPDQNQTVVHHYSGHNISSYHEIYYFDQLIDHSNPSLGTFQQRYWHTYEFYERGACYRHPPDECPPDMNAPRSMFRRSHRPLHAWRV